MLQAKESVMAVVNPDKIGAILRECAELYIKPRYKMLADHEISSKTGPHDLVTQADIDVEYHLERVLPALLPGSVVLGEEGISRGDAVLETLKDETLKIWLVDPIDGTHNFVKHGREFGVMLGCIIHGRTEYGWIYDVLAGEMSMAERQSGAFCGDRRLSVARAAPLDDMSGHINPRYFPEIYRDVIKQKRALFKSCKSLYCAAHEYLRLAKGEAHFSVYSRIKPWDHVPGALILEEAGGIVRRWSGEPYKPSDFHEGIICSSDSTSWDATFNTFLSDNL